MKTLFITIGDELDNILHADGATGDAVFPNPRADWRLWLKFLAHDELPRANANRPHPETADLMLSK